MLDGAHYASPRSVAPADCDFYHVMDLPGVGQVGGQWDLRGRVDQYLGGIELGGKRVLEIGPASGFLTMEMEKRGAQVVALEVPDDPGWDYVPYAKPALDISVRRESMRRIKNAFWLTHRLHDLRATLCYGDATAIPASLGRFDTAVLAAVLLHTRSPLAIVESCSRVAEQVVITEIFHPALENLGPVCTLNPTAKNASFDTWWNFSPAFFGQFLDVRGFSDQQVTRHFQRHAGGETEFFTLVAAP